MELFADTLNTKVPDGNSLKAAVEEEVDEESELELELELEEDELEVFVDVDVFEFWIDDDMVLDDGVL